MRLCCLFKSQTIRMRALNKNGMPFSAFSLSSSPRMGVGTVTVVASRCVRACVAAWVVRVMKRNGEGGEEDTQTGY